MTAHTAASPRSAHSKVQNEVELLVEWPLLAPEVAGGKGVVVLPVKKPLELAALPHDGVGVPLAHCGAQLVVLLGAPHVVVGSGVDRAVDLVRSATDGLHDVDLAAVWPAPISIVGRQHPDRWPGALPLWQARANIDPVAWPP